MSHIYQPPTNLNCQECGMPELAHSWSCQEHNSAGTGAYCCTKCYQEIDRPGLEVRTEEEG
jgi:hypothetical protein